MKVAVQLVLCRGHDVVKTWFAPDQSYSLSEVLKAVKASIEARREALMGDDSELRRIAVK